MRISPKDFRGSATSASIFFRDRSAAETPDPRAGDHDRGAQPRSGFARSRPRPEKREEYHAIGVPEYLIVDRAARRVFALIHEPAGYADRIITEADICTATPLLPGLAVFPCPTSSRRG